jgi:hypothetical protein
MFKIGDKVISYHNDVCFPINRVGTIQGFEGGNVMVEFNSQYHSPICVCPIKDLCYAENGLTRARRIVCASK